jgi:hypothetical protein
MLQSKLLRTYLFFVLKYALIQMSGVWKNYRLLCLLLVVFLKLVWAVDEAALIHLFIRKPETHELKFAGAETHEPGTFNSNNTICAWKTSFITQKNPLQNYLVIEYQDYEKYKEYIMTYVSNNSKFMMANSEKKTWYLYDNGNITEISLDEKFETSELSHVCYIDNFFFPSDISDKETALAVYFAILATSLAIVATTIYIKLPPSNEYAILFKIWWHPDAALGMACSALFSMTTVGNIIQKYEIGGKFLPLISTMAHWYFSFIMLFIVGQMLTSQCHVFRQEGEPSTLRIVLIRYSILLLMAVAILIVTVLLYMWSIIGPDNASTQTGYSYVNTLVGSPDSISFCIRVM